MGEVVRHGVMLVHQDLVIATIPCPRPILVGPNQQEGEVRLFQAQYLVHRALEKLSPVEPIMVIGETA
jgi:hypothetical protein